jgi:hypothetical protein
MHEEIKDTLNSGNTCYHLVQSFVFKICKTIILHFLYGCETWSLTLREEYRLS